MSLEWRDVGLRLGGQPVLEGVTLRVPSGACYGLIGHNGAGKTSAMRVALGLVRATRGTVLVDGFDAAREPREARARLGALIEAPGFHGQLDAARNLELLARLQGLARVEARREAARLLPVVGLARLGTKPVQQFSQGMRQRLGIAQALLGDPRYLLLDEPMNGLDPEGMAEVRELVRALVRDRGLSVLLSSHHLHELGELCTHIGLMRSGTVLVEAETRVLLGAVPGRFELATDDDARAAEVLRARGCEARSLPTGGLEVAQGARRGPELARALLDAGLELRRFGEQPPGLEEIYLRLARGEELAQRAAPRAAPREPELRGARLEPRAGVASALRAELDLLRARSSTLVLVCLPALCGAAAVVREVLQANAEAARVASGELATATQRTGFSATAAGLQAGLPVLALVLTGIASQALAGELARGTLRNALTRPLLRAELLLGKACALVLFMGAAQLTLAAVVLGLARVGLGFGDLAELLPNGELFPLVPASELWPPLWRALWVPLAALSGALGLGLCASACTRSAAGALGLALGLLAGIDVLRGIARGSRLEPWLLCTHLPSPLGDRSFVQAFADRSEGISNARPEFAQAWFGLPADIAWPMLWCVVCLGLAAARFSRRAIA